MADLQAIIFKKISTTFCYAVIFLLALIVAVYTISQAQKLSKLESPLIIHQSSLPDYQ